MIKLRVFVAGVLALAAGAVGGTVRQATIADPAAREICASVATVELPSADRPTVQDRTALAGCSSLDLYFGFGMPPDPARARKCAYLEMEKGESEPALGGRAVLMMVYANGKGAARNFDVALKLACAIDGAPQDAAGRVRQLARLKAGNWTGDRFSICDHSSGRALYGQCAALQDRFDAPERAASLQSIVNGWTAEQRNAFTPLRQAADAFFRARAGREVNLEATVEPQERAFLEDQFIASLRQFDGGETPSFSADDLRASETALQAAYAATQQGPTRKWGTVTPDAISDTQKLWIAYRDAWLAFGKARYPAVSAVSWQTWLTQERAEMLRRFTFAPKQ